ncbi:hypothetical protein BCR32DRAFT_326849 [Anaeromyces robustus]|uniref:CBM10 domain-containing protein n=1 Tax=Anaeromyces robustus TaxID=1754192 RepID=A0A1Y1X9K6_9FUNG|nr:hypothetical protein BCR32DRAFT_326849 [Anaeromyces robustus]|eukprot:ORX82418.1 hypothetical protein BCR32DRAFT_326849 [Anaeromyces robustus]
MPASEYTQLKNTINSSGGGMFGGGGGGEFKTKNAQLVFTNGDDVKEFAEVTFSLGGFSSRFYPRQAFNVKIRNDKLYGRKQFRIRSEAREATFLRSKLFCDINNRLGQPDSVSANYMKMSINGEDLGFYVVMDSLKMTYVKIEHDDPDTTNLIKCGDLHSDLTANSIKSCENENDDNPDMTNFRQLLSTLDRANRVDQFEDIFDVETFMKAVLMEWLTGSWDHYTLYGHNFSMYRPPNGKWEIVLYDFDATFGQDLSSGFMFGTPKGISSNNIDTWTKAKFEDWHGGKHVINVILQDRPEIFRKCLQEIITTAFNPKILFDHIDNLKEFIRPYVEEDKKNLPGRMNTRSSSADYTISQWDANSEFTHINSSFMGMNSQSYGLKRWILDKFNFVCDNYSFVDCSVASEYLNNRFTYTTTTVIQPTNVNGGGGFGFGQWGGQQPGGQWGGQQPGGQWPGQQPGGQWGGQQPGGQWPGQQPGGQWGGQQLGGQWPGQQQGGQWPGQQPGGQWGGQQPGWNMPTPTTTTTTRRTTTTTRRTTTTTKKTEPTNDVSCWSTALGYPCCTNANLDVLFTDDDGDWSIENNNWCGIRKVKECWSLILGYKCCSSCLPIVETDSSGNWSIEDNQWCGLEERCK